MLWSVMFYLLFFAVVIMVGALSKRFPTNSRLKKLARLLKRRLIWVKRFVKRLFNNFKRLIFKKSAA